MTGLDWDLNLGPDQQPLARRLSFSDADSAEPLRASRSLESGRRSSSRHDHAPPRLPVLPPIYEGDSEGEEEKDDEEETPIHPSHCAAPPSVPVTSSSALYPAHGELPLPTFDVTPRFRPPVLNRFPRHRRRQTTRPSARRHPIPPASPSSHPALVHPSSVAVPGTPSSTLYPAQGETPRTTSAPVHPSQCAASPSVPVTPPTTLYPVQGDMPRSTSAPVHPSRCAAPPSVPVTPPTTLYPAQGEMPRSTSAPVDPSQCAATPSVPVTPHTTLYPAQGEMPRSTSAPVDPSQCAATPSVSVTPPTTLYPAQGEMPRSTSAPVDPSLPLVAVATTSEYQRQQQALAAAMRARAQVRQLRLYTVAGRPAGYETKWNELHHSSQRLLLGIEEKLGEYKYQSQQLDQCSRLHDPSSHSRSFEHNASQIMQVLGSISTIIDRERVSIKGLTDVVQEMMWNTDIALSSYNNLRPKFVHRGAGGAAGHANCLGSDGYTEFSQRLTKAPTFCCYSGAPRRPSPFIQLTIARFEEQSGECFKWIEELEQYFQMRNDKPFPESLECLSKVLSNTHDFFIHVASKVEGIHQAVEAMKTQYLNNCRCWGDWNDPFVEADKRDSAKQEATVRMVHPTLHLSLPSQPTTPVTASVMASH